MADALDRWTTTFFSRLLVARETERPKHGPVISSMTAWSPYPNTFLHYDSCESDASSGYE